MDDHSSGAPVTGHLMQPTRMAKPGNGPGANARHPYSVLLPVGFAVPPPLPETRCALTAPFHPYPESGAVCFLWHFPWGYPRRTLSGTVLPWSPDFPPPRRIRPQSPCAPAAVIQPAGIFMIWGFRKKISKIEAAKQLDQVRLLSASRVAMVERSARPSTRRDRKWR